MQYELLEKYVNYPMECTAVELDAVREYLQDDFDNVIRAIDMMRGKAVLELIAGRVVAESSMSMAEPAMPVAEPEMPMAIEADYDEGSCDLCHEEGVVSSRPSMPKTAAASALTAGMFCKCKGFAYKMQTFDLVDALNTYLFG